jgi:hypothetical protein
MRPSDFVSVRRSNLRPAKMDDYTGRNMVEQRPPVGVPSFAFRRRRPNRGHELQVIYNEFLA